MRNTGPIWAAPMRISSRAARSCPISRNFVQKTDTHVFRIAYIFDPGRKGLLLTGGDKKGTNQRKFYKDLIKAAEYVYIAWFEKITKEKEE
jgi:hypothetical protein